MLPRTRAIAGRPVWTEAGKRPGRPPGSRIDREEYGGPGSGGALGPSRVSGWPSCARCSGRIRAFRRSQNGCPSGTSYSVTTFTEECDCSPNGVTAWSSPSSSWVRTATRRTTAASRNARPKDLGAAPLRLVLRFHRRGMHGTRPRSCGFASPTNARCFPKTP